MSRCRNVDRNGEQQHPSAESCVRIHRFQMFPKLYPPGLAWMRLASTPPALVFHIQRGTNTGIFFYLIKKKSLTITAFVKKRKKKSKSKSVPTCGEQSKSSRLDWVRVIGIRGPGLEPLACGGSWSSAPVREAASQWSHVTRILLMDIPNGTGWIWWRNRRWNSLSTARKSWRDWQQHLPVKEKMTQLISFMKLLWFSLNTSAFSFCLQFSVAWFDLNFIKTSD